MGEKKLTEQKEMVSEDAAASWFDAIKGYPASSVRLHAPFEAPGAFGMERTLNRTKVRGLRMKYDGNNVWWVKGKIAGWIHGSATAGGIIEW